MYSAVQTLALNGIDVRGGLHEYLGACAANGGRAPPDPSRWLHDRHGGLLALLGFSTAARKLAPRDRFIGWTSALREKNLPRVIDNARFLILPWIRIPNLASHPWHCS